MPKGIYKRKTNLNLLFFKNKVLYKENGCIEFTGAKNADGYGYTELKGKRLATHRLSFIMHYGEIEKGMLVLHECDNPPCLNPDHLFIGTHSDNSIDARNKGRLKSKFIENAKLSKETADLIRLEFKNNMVSRKKLGEKYGVTSQAVGLIINNKIWKE